MPSLDCAQAEPSGDSKPRQVRFIRFEGAHLISAQELKKILTTREKGMFRWLTKAPLDEQAFAEDLERIEKYYRSRGFYHARVVSHEVVPLVGRDVRIEIKLEEGPPMLVTEVNLTVDGEPSGPWHDEILRLVLPWPGERFTTPKYQDSEKAILAHLGNWGYPKARVDMSARLNKETNQGAISIEVQKGPVCYFGSVSLEGNVKVSDDVILREVTFKTSERFNASKIQETQQRLFNLDLFQVVELNVGNTDGEETTLPVRILLKESKKQTIRVGAGYGTEDDLRGQVQYEIRNFLGDGRRLQVNAKGSSLVQLLEGRFLQPYVLDPRSSLNADAGVRHEDQESFENRRFYLTPVLNYKWSDRLASNFGYNLEANRLLNTNVDLEELGPGNRENQEYFVSSLLGGLTWEKVDVPLNPSRGLRLIENLEWASVGLGSEVDYLKLTLEGRGYLPFPKFGGLAAKLKWGGIAELENTEDIPIFKRFFAGGSDSVRGYPYQRLGPLDNDGDPIGGLTSIEGSLEWRFPVREPFEGVLFFDFGNVYKESFRLLWDDLGYSVGAGVRYLTLVGPLRLDFGYQLNPPEQEFFNPYQIHFSIGQAF